MVTDAIVLVMLICFVASGWRKGALKSLLGPISLILGCLIAYIYYQKTKNLAISLSICIFGPFAIRILASMMIGLWKKANRDDSKPSLLSRIIGSAFNVAWCGTYIALVLLLAGLTPKSIPAIEPALNDILASKSYSTVQQFLNKKVPAASEEINKIGAIIDNPELIKQFQSTKEFEELTTDDNILEILEDEELAKQIEEKDYGKLMTNPKFQSLLNNEELLKKIFTFQKRILEEELNLEYEEPSSPPKIITIE